MNIIARILDFIKTFPYKLVGSMILCALIIMAVITGYWAGLYLFFDGEFWMLGVGAMVCAGFATKPLYELVKKYFPK